MLFDICILLLILNQSYTKQRALKSLTNLCLNGQLGLEVLIEAFQQTHLFQAHSQALLSVCKHFLTEGNKYLFLLDWSEQLFEITFERYDLARNEIVSTLLSLCAVTKFNIQK